VAAVNYNNVNPQPDFELLVEKVRSVWIDTSISGYPNETVSDIRCPVLVMRGDDDFLFSLDEAVELVEQIENTKFMNIAYAEHEAHKESPDICCSIISQSLSCANET
jgi:pimeloyl-ACP methyl ester carboxylesterase